MPNSVTPSMPANTAVFPSRPEGEIGRRARASSTAEETLQRLASEKPPQSFLPVEQYLIVVICRDEKHQVELLGRCHDDGLACRALLS